MNKSINTNETNETNKTNETIFEKEDFKFTKNGSNNYCTSFSMKNNNIILQNSKYMTKICSTL